MNKTRPILKNLVVNNTTVIEKFQNLTIRPIIKMQHNILIALFKSYLTKRKVDFQNSTIEKKKDRIKTVFLKDNSFKNLCLGVIVGQFKIEEYTIYEKHNSEFSKRIFTIISQRLQDSLSEI